jgi:uncharacterized protein with FMN-binding domain
MRRVILAIVATAAALVFVLSFKTHPPTVAATSPASASGSPNPGAGGAAGSATAGSAVAGSASASRPAGTKSGSGGSKTVTGLAVNTAYGPVQVQITVKGGKVTTAQATVYPQETPRDEQINAFAIPQLNQETVAASSARVDAVSGATYTSQGYIGSLQSAVDQAGL